jgi:hypothetical protein
MLARLLWPSGEAPGRLSEGHLVGGRSPTPINVYLLIDRSGSFDPYTEMQDEARAQVVAWAPKNLRSDDTLTIIDFAGNAGISLATTTMAELVDGTPSFRSPMLRGGTAIMPPLEIASNNRPSTGVATVIVVTDTVTTDVGNGAAIDLLLADLNVVSMSVITPTWVGVESNWRDTFPWAAEFTADSDDPDDIALAIGQALAHATGQKLEK